MAQTTTTESVSADAGPRPAPTYRGYHINFYAPPIPFRGCDWHFVHQDYDEGDRRYGSAASEAECRAEIDMIEDDQ